MIEVGPSASGPVEKTTPPVVESCWMSLCGETATPAVASLICRCSAATIVVCAAWSSSCRSRPVVRSSRAVPARTNRFSRPIASFFWSTAPHRNWAACLPR